LVWVFAFFSACVLISAVYHVGRMDGGSDLDRWMKDNNVHHFEQVCPK
jgi:hypothetical protein